MEYNWSTFNNEEFARLIRNGGIVAGFDTDFNRAMGEETARRIEAAESRAAAAEQERSDLYQKAVNIVYQIDPIDNDDTDAISRDAVINSMRKLSGKDLNDASLWFTEAEWSGIIAERDTLRAQLAAEQGAPQDGAGVTTEESSKVMTQRQYTDEYFENQTEQAKIKSAIVAAIPVHVTYFNLVLALTDLLRDFAKMAFKDEVTHYDAAKHPLDTRRE